MMNTAQLTRKPTVLLVLRDQKLLDALEDLLETASFRVSVTANPYKAPEFIKLVHFDVLVLDMDFPECRSGAILDMLQESTAANPLLQIILLGALAPPPEVVAPTLRIHNYMLKPFDPAWLIRSIQHACETAGFERENTRLKTQEAQINSKIEGLRDRLSRLQAKSYGADLAQSLTHELKNLFSSIKVSAHFLLKKGRDVELDSKMMKHLEIISQQVDRSQEQILRFSSYSHGEEVSEQICSVNTVITDLLTLLQYLLESHNIAVRTDLQADLPSVMLQESALRTVLINLILNSRDAMPEGGNLTLRSRLAPAAEPRQSPKIEILVEDNGPGIPDEAVERVFEPFYSTKKSSSSTGIGLSIARGLAESFGASLSALPGLQPGAHFLLSIPVGERPENRREQILRLASDEARGSMKDQPVKQAVKSSP
ncbi:MAG: response regulator [Candidatus Sumerlaeaceae bacterium]|nr:response regulator [Candidatus Sumerlaeaceae bacterium]